MPAPSIQQVRDTISSLIQRYPEAGKKKLVRILNAENNWELTTKEFRKHCNALEKKAEPPAHGILCNAIKTLRVQNPTMGKKKFTNMLNTTNGWSIPTKEVRQCLMAVDFELVGDDSEVM